MKKIRFTCVLVSLASIALLACSQRKPTTTPLQSVGHEAGKITRAQSTETEQRTVRVRFQVQEKDDRLEFFVDNASYALADLSSPNDFSLGKHVVSVRRDGELLFEVPFDVVSSEQLMVVDVISPMRVAALAIINAGGSVKTLDATRIREASGMPTEYFAFNEVFFYRTQFDDSVLEVLKDISLRNLDASYSNISDKGIRLIDDLSQLKAVGLNRTNVTADGLSLIAKAGPPLIRVLVDGLELPDEFLSHLQTCQLDLISANDTNFSDKYMVALSGKSFWWCNLDGTKITDHGLKALRGTTIRKELRLSNTDISDEGIKHLLELEHCGKISLENTRVTDAGCELLRNRFPEIEISR